MECAVTKGRKIRVKVKVKVKVTTEWHMLLGRAAKSNLFLWLIEPLYEVNLNVFVVNPNVFVVMWLILTSVVMWLILTLDVVTCHAT